MTSTWACEYAVDLDSLHSYLHEEMAHAQLRYQGPADAKHTLAPDFKVGDQAYVKAKYFQSTQPSKKLSEKNLGPYTIIAQVGSLSFTLCQDHVQLWTLIQLLQSHHSSAAQLWSPTHHSSLGRAHTLPLSVTLCIFVSWLAQGTRQRL